MRARTTLTALLLVALCLTAAADGAARAHKKTACDRLSGRDLAGAKRLKVVLRDDRDGTVRVLACTLHGGKVRTISSLTPDGEFATVRVDVVATGIRHALLSEVSAEQGSGFTLVRVDTRTRRRAEVASGSCDPTQLCFDDDVADAVMHRSGAVALVVRDLGPCCAPAAGAGPPQLIRVTKGGVRTVLDEGDITALRVDGDSFRWSRGAEAKRARVAGG